MEPLTLVLVGAGGILVARHLKRRRAITPQDPSVQPREVPAAASPVPMTDPIGAFLGGDPEIVTAIIEDPVTAIGDIGQALLGGDAEDQALRKQQDAYERGWLRRAAEIDEEIYRRWEANRFNEAVGMGTAFVTVLKQLAPQFDPVPAPFGELRSHITGLTTRDGKSMGDTIPSILNMYTGWYLIPGGGRPATTWFNREYNAALTVARLQEIVVEREEAIVRAVEYTPIQEYMLEHNAQFTAYLQQRILPSSMPAGIERDAYTRWLQIRGISE